MDQPDVTGDGRPVELQPDVNPPEQTPRASDRWLLALTLFGSYFLLQIAIAAPVLLLWLQSGRLESPNDLEAILFSEPGLWLTLGAAALAAAATIGLAVAWPPIWARLSPSARFPFADWFAWRPPERLPLWSIPVGTVALVLGLSSLVYVVSGDAEVEAQAALYATSSLQIVTTIVVSSIVPAAEELIFRGALYNALLPPASGRIAGWRRHLAPLLISSLFFAGVHLLAGFESIASLLLITLFALVLGVLRAVTGSIQTTILSHAVWNAIASLALAASSNLPV